MQEINELFTDEDFIINNRNIYTHMVYDYHNPGLHHHTFIELFYVLTGQCKHRINGKTQTIKSGDAYLLMPTDSHILKHIKSDSLHRDIIFKASYFRSVCDLYSPDLYNNLCNDTIKKSFSFTNQQLNHLENLIQPLILDTCTDITLLTGNICTFIVNTLLEQNLQHETENYPAWISRLLSLLSTPKNFRTDYKKLISMFPYRQEHVCRTFKKLVGKTITDYFNEQKMKYARALLQSSAYSIEQICECINIGNVPYFYRLFKKHFNMTPREVVPSTKKSPSISE